jgi:hypothetical protein
LGIKVKESYLATNRYIQYSNGNIKDSKWDKLREKFGAGEGGTSAGSAN